MIFFPAAGRIGRLGRLEEAVCIQLQMALPAERMNNRILKRRRKTSKKESSNFPTPKLDDHRFQFVCPFCQNSNRGRDVRRKLRPENLIVKRSSQNVQRLQLISKSARFGSDSEIVFFSQSRSDTAHCTSRPTLERRRKKILRF